MGRYLLPIAIVGLLVAAHGCGDDGDGGVDAGASDTGTSDSGGTEDSGTCDPDASALPVPDWSCLGSVAVPAPAAAQVTAAGDLRDFGSGSVEASYELQFCERTDTDCTTPRFTTTVDMGIWSADLPTDPDPWWGFARILPDDGEPDQYVYATMPLYEDATITLIFIPRTVVNATALLAGETQDFDANGAVALIAVECPEAGIGMFAPGVRFEILSGAGTLVYANDSEDPCVSPEQTGEFGTGAIVNAAPGDFTVAAYRASDERLISTAEFPVRAGVVTTVYFPPTPDGAAYQP